MGFCLLCVWMFFFLKQKTAYEMRISDWSSDVCSSDLRARMREQQRAAGLQAPGASLSFAQGSHDFESLDRGIGRGDRFETAHRLDQYLEIGRASCRERCVSKCRPRWSPHH